jgi:hypothetical protein
MIVVAFATLLSFAPLGSVAAQDDVPSLREQRQTLEDGGLPSASELGSGWALGVAQSYSSATTPTFEIHEAVYADGFGTRVHILAGIHDRRSESAALDLFTFILESHATLLVASDYAPTARELRALDDPSGCDDVQRATGEEPLTYFFVGSLLCHDSDNDRMLLVLISGNYNGFTFQEAAEEVLEIVLDVEPASGVMGTKD